MMQKKIDTCVDIAGIYYPKRKVLYQSDIHVHYEFSFDTGKNLELKISGIPKYKFMYADEKQFITKKRTNTFQISDDEGHSWTKEKTIDDLDIFQIYPLSNGNYLVGGIGISDKTISLIYTLDNNLNILAKHNICQMPWHSQNAIDESNSVVMFAEYQNFAVGTSLPTEVSIFRSTDFGLTWEKVFTLKHPEEMRHWHTLQKDSYHPTHWIATGGDAPEQARWFLSKDNGDSWVEVTDKNYYNASAHRTTAIVDNKEYYYYSTDDLMGRIPLYFQKHNGVRQSSSHFYRATKTEPIKIEYLSNLGIHGRSMIDIGEGYIIITEGKYVTFNTQVFYIAKDNLKKPYFLFDFYGHRRHSGPASMHSKLIHNKYFYIPIPKGLFFDNSEVKTLKWDITYKYNKEPIEYNINQYIKFEEHLWFLDNIESIDTITFIGNSVTMTLKERENTFYLLLGDSLIDRFSSKELFSLSHDKETIEVTFFVKFRGNTDIECHIQTYDDKDMLSSSKYTVQNGLNTIRYKKDKEEQYFRILFFIQAKQKDEINLSDLKIDFLHKDKSSIYTKKLSKESHKRTNSIIQLNKDKWLIENQDIFTEVYFLNDTLNMKVDLSNESKAAYIKSIYLNIEEARRILNIHSEITFNHSTITLFLVEFTQNKEKITTQSYTISKGKNTHNYLLLKDTRFIQILFRFNNKRVDSVMLRSLQVTLKNDLPENVKKHINNLYTLERKSYLLTLPQTTSMDSYSFNPRKDTQSYNIDLPLNWDINPYNENNWMFQLNALRLLDREISNYMLKKDHKLLERIIMVILDWKRDIIDDKKNLDFNRVTYPDSFAWHDMATGLRGMKIAFVLETVIKLGDKNPLYPTIYELYELATIHIEALDKQTLASNNHAIYQLHGLLMLLRLFPSDMEKMYTLKQNSENDMLAVFYQQFFIEGIHRENSAKYHFFAIDTFEKILEKNIYPDIMEVFNVLEQAKKNCAYMHFPNDEILTTGDSDFGIINPRKEEEIKEGITYFKESGYTYIYEKNDNTSMLFFDTAFLNRTHRHADFFNVLLYEYGKNILVDAGKYSYMAQNPFRKYCISSRGHNVILIDNKDYKLDRKYFFNSKLIKNEKIKDYYYLLTSHHYDYVKTSHDRHIFYKPGEFLCIIDILISDEDKNFKQLFHLHQDIEVSKEKNSLQAAITEDVIMNISMKSLDIPENKIYSNISHSKGLEGTIEGYRALGHNEIVENYVLVNEFQGSEAVLGSIFTFNKQLTFNINCLKQGILEIEFDKYKVIIDDKKQNDK